MQTAQAYGCQRVDEFVDAEKEKTTVFALSKKTWLEKYKMRQEKGTPLYQYFPCQKEKTAIEQVEKLIEDVSQMVERVNQSLQELTESVPDAAEKGWIHKNDVERITKSIESAKKILQIVNQIEWYADDTH